MTILNWLNRGLVVLLLALLLLAGLAAAIAPAWVAGLLREFADVLEATSRLYPLALALLSLLLLGLELRLRKPAAVALAGEPGARLSTQSVVDRLRGDVEAVADVVRVRPLVTPRGKSVDVELAVETGADVDVPTKAGEIRTVAMGSIERLGLKPGRVEVRLSQSAAAVRLPPPEQQ